MFLCEVDGIKEYHTKPEIEKYGYKRIGRNALMTRHGRPSPEYAYRMSTQFVRDIRMLWEETANKALKDAGLDEKIDCRSYIDQNSQKIAEMHLGQSITTMQKKISRLQSEGKSISESLKYDIILLNKEIRKHNHMVDLYESRLASVGSEYNELDSYSRRLAVIKSAWISERCHRRELEQQIVKLTEDMEALQDKVKNYKSTMSSIEQKISSLISEKEDLEALLSHKNHPFKPLADLKIKKRIDKLSCEINNYNDRSIMVKEAYGYTDSTMLKVDELLLQRVYGQLDLAEKQL